METGAHDSLIRHMQQRSVMFFAGSGISIESGLPSVPEILESTIGAFLPTRATADSQWLTSIQPEVFYGALLEVYDGNYETLGLWRALHPNWSHGSTGSDRPRPNIAHHMIVLYSFLVGVPVLTTNFDTMFEDACVELGLEFELRSHRDDPPGPLTPAHSPVQVCKLHGSISGPDGSYTPEDLRTTMVGITAINEPWIRAISDHLQELSICFVGYSGRDIDYFPAMASGVAKRPVFWMGVADSPEPGTAAGATRDNALRIGAELIREFPSQAFPSIWTPVLDVISEDKSWPIPPARRRPTVSAAELVARQVQHLPSRPELELLLWQRLLECQGKISLAWEIGQMLDSDSVAETLSASQHILYLGIMLRLARELAYFRTYRRRAKRLRSAAKRVKDPGLRIHTLIYARIEIISSLLMEIPYGLPFTGKPRFLDMALAAWVIAGARLFRVHLALLKMRYPNHARSIQESFTVAEFRVREIATHLAILDSLERFLPRVVARYRTTLTGQLESIRNEAHQAGNHATVISALKYLNRLGGQENGEAADQVASLSGDISARGILRRDEVSRRTEDAVLSLLDARQFFAEGDNHLSEIKVLLQLAETRQRSGLPPLTPVEAEQLRDLIDGIESIFLTRTLNRAARALGI